MAPGNSIRGRRARNVVFIIHSSIQAWPHPRHIFTARTGTPGWRRICIKMIVKLDNLAPFSPYWREFLSLVKRVRSANGGSKKELSNAANRALVEPAEKVQAKLAWSGDGQVSRDRIKHGGEIR